MEAIATTIEAIEATNAEIYNNRGNHRTIEANIEGNTIVEETTVTA